MANGDTLRSIEAILTGQEEIPANVTNRLLLMAMAEQYQRSVAETDRIKRLEERIEQHSLEIKSHCLMITDNTDEINRLRTRSNWSDGLLAIGTAIAAALGFAK